MGRACGGCGFIMSIPLGKWLIQCIIRQKISVIELGRLHENYQEKEEI